MYVSVVMTGRPPVGVSLVLDDQVLFVDGLQQRSGQRLEVGDGLRCDGQAAALLLQEQLLHYRKKKQKKKNMHFFFISDLPKEKQTNMRRNVREGGCVEKQCEWPQS